MVDTCSLNRLSHLPLKGLADQICDQELSSSWQYPGEALPNCEGNMVIAILADKKYSSLLHPL